MLDRPITIIAECGINHCGCMSQARDMIYMAKRLGADVAKFQIYVPERVLDMDHPVIQEHWDIIKAAELSFEDVHLLEEICRGRQIEFLASVFHPDRVEWTEKIGMERYKIASRSIYDEKLAEAIAATGKPIILSWGYARWDDLTIVPLVCWPEAWAKTKHLYCISKYPTPLGEVRLGPWMFKQGSYDGFSDHTVGITASVMAMSLGATIIEKHFTLDRGLPGCDQACSIEPDELRQLCDMRDDIEEMLYGDH